MKRILQDGDGGGRARHGPRAEHRILLDGRPMRTPAKACWRCRPGRLREAIAAEWEAQRDHIDPACMPLTRLVNSAIDGVRGREAEVRAEIAKYAGKRPGVLSRHRARGAGAAPGRAVGSGACLGSRGAGGGFPGGRGVDAGGPARGGAGSGCAGAGATSAFALAALHVMTTLTGSALLALAHARGGSRRGRLGGGARRRGLADRQMGRGCRGGSPPAAPLGRDAGREPAAALLGRSGEGRKL